METMNKVKCPVCPKGILFAVDNSVNCGKIEGKCGWCSTIAIYDTETKEYKIVSTKGKVKLNK